jgi:hypothetical protein
MQHWDDPRAQQAVYLFVHLMSILLQNVWRLACPPENYAFLPLAMQLEFLSSCCKCVLGFNAFRVLACDQKRVRKLQGYVHNMAQTTNYMQSLTRSKQTTERQARKNLAAC